MSKFCTSDLEFSLFVVELALLRSRIVPVDVHLPFRRPLLAFSTNFSCAGFALLAASKPEV